jgi:hypothetical protein
VPTSLPVSAHKQVGAVFQKLGSEFEFDRRLRKTSTRQRGLLKASWTAAKRFGAKYALLQRAPISCRLSGSLSPDPGIGIASASCAVKRGA